MTDPKEATLHTRCPVCGRPVTWRGALDLEQEIECEHCGARGTVREFVAAAAKRRED